MVKNKFLQVMVFISGLSEFISGQFRGLWECQSHNQYVYGIAKTVKKAPEKDSRCSQSSDI